MSSLRARVVGGRIHIDQATELPEGTVLDLVLDDEGDDLSEDERRARDEAIGRAWQEAQAGQAVSAADVLEKLRRRR